MRRLLVLLVLGLTLAAPAVAEAAYNVRITSVVVNPNRTITVNWWLYEETDSMVTDNSELTLDGRTIKTWTENQSTSWTSLKPLTPGRHSISLETFTVFWSNKYYEHLNCDISRRDSYIWVCAYSDTVSRSFTVPTGGGRTAAASGAKSTSTQCIVPDVVGLRLSDARARLRSAGCKAGSITQAISSRGGGTVLKQKPLRDKRFARGALVDLTIARY